MKQYCKYCANAYPHGDGYCYCEEKRNIISEVRASKTNICNKFILNEISVFDPEQIYKMQKGKADDGEQERLEL